MAMVLTKSQSSTLADFCSDVAKGLLLAAATNQLLPSATPPLVKMAGLAIGIGFSLVFLALALKFSTDESYAS